MKTLVVQVCTVLLLCFVVSGCAAVVVAGAAGAAGAGYVYTQGALQDTIEDPPPAVAKAVLAAFAENSISKESVTSNSDGIIIKGKTAGDHGVTVKIVEEPTLLEKSFSKISIRVGLIGDEALSRKIYTDTVLKLK